MHPAIGWPNLQRTACALSYSSDGRRKITTSPTLARANTVAKTVGAQFDAMLTAMKALQRQVETLSEKIDEALEGQE